MSFCKHASSAVLNNTTAVDNIFISQFMPNANGDCVKVYLYGLYLCNNGNDTDNTLTHFAKVLGLSEADVVSAFTHWADEGLVQIIETNPIEVRYLPAKANFAKIKKYSEEKYAGFNASAQSLLEGRMITPTEFTEYYAFLEYSKMESSALLMIIKYCINLKDNKVGYPYILTVAKNWLAEGIKTCEAVEERLKEEEKNTSAVADVLKTLGAKRKPSTEEYTMYKKWADTLGFTNSAIIAAAKQCKKGGFNQLDAMLINLYNIKAFTPEQIENYQTTKAELTTLAREINKKIGLYYENVDNIVDTYLTDWQLKGFDGATLLEIASYCFKRGIRTLDGMNNQVMQFYKQGIVSGNDVAAFQKDMAGIDTQIKSVLTKMNQNRNVTQWDRDMYSTWVNDWNMSSDLINYGATLANDKANAMQYLNRVLSNFYTQKITTVADAQKTAVIPSFVQNLNTKSFESEEKIKEKKVKLNKEVEQQENYKKALENPEFKKLDEQIRKLTLEIGKLAFEGKPTQQKETQLAELKKKQKKLS